MKISQMRTYVATTAWRNLTFVVLDTDEGLTGVGEARMLNHTDALLGYLNEAFPNYVLGTDPFNIEDLVRRMSLLDYARMGEVGMTALAVVETACWDIVGQALNQPVYRLLGGAVRDRIPVYANGWYNVPRDPDSFAAAARVAIGRGYRALKFDPFPTARYALDRREFHLGIGLVEAVRNAVGPDVELLIDLHGRYTATVGIEIARQLQAYSVGWIEEPVPPDDFLGLTRATATSVVPIATGERIHSRNEYRQLFECRGVDIIQPDISHLGGILEVRKLAATAETYNVLVAPHNVTGPVGTMAAIQLDAVLPNFLIQECFNDFDVSWVQDLVEGAPQVIDGYFNLPSGTGLGVTVNVAALEEHKRKPVYYSPFAENWQLRSGSERA